MSGFHQIHYESTGNNGFPRKYIVTKNFEKWITLYGLENEQWDRRKSIKDLLDFGLKQIIVVRYNTQHVFISMPQTADVQWEVHLNSHLQHLLLTSWSQSTGPCHTQPITVCLDWSSSHTPSHGDWPIVLWHSEGVSEEGDETGRGLRCLWNNTASGWVPHPPTWCPPRVNFRASFIFHLCAALRPHISKTLL